MRFGGGGSSNVVTLIPDAYYFDNSGTLLELMGYAEGQLGSVSPLTFTMDGETYKIKTLLEGNIVEYEGDPNKISADTELQVENVNNTYPAMIKITRCDNEDWYTIVGDYNNPPQGKYSAAETSLPGIVEKGVPIDLRFEVYTEGQ